MANYFTRFLVGLGQGLTNPKGNMGDFQHASRVFVDNTFRLAPRTKFTFHVYLDINPYALQASNWKAQHHKEAGMLVKTADLPKFTLQTEVKNQYNKKKIVYKDITYDPVNITFHDDNLGLINSLWAQYMAYISPDRLNPPAAYNAKSINVYRSTGQGSVTADEAKDGATTTGSVGGGFDFYRYGLDKDGYTEPFFRSITIYTLARKRFNSYTLINPMITSWTSGQMDYGQSNGMNEMTMSLQYETVFYGYGTITRGAEPKGFADLHYDTAPSPLTIGGGGTSTIFGANGVLGGLYGSGLAGAQLIFKNDYGNINGTPNFFGAAINAINTYRSLSNININTIKQEAVNILTVPNNYVNNLGPLPGIVINNGVKPGG